MASARVPPPHPAHKYDRPLGAPLSDAVLVDGESLYRREFAYGPVAWFNMTDYAGWIDWPEPSVVM